MIVARNCLNCETHQQMTRFEGETFTIQHAGMTTTVEGLSGWRCASCNEVEFDTDSARHYAAASDALVRSEREAPEWIETVSEFDNDAAP